MMSPVNGVWVTGVKPVRGVHIAPIDWADATSERGGAHHQTGRWNLRFTAVPAR